MLFNLKTFMLYLRISISFHAANRRGVCIVISRDSSLVFVDQKILFFYFPIDLEIKVEENVIQSHAVQNAHRWGEENVTLSAMLSKMLTVGVRKLVIFLSWR